MTRTLAEFAKELNIPLRPFGKSEVSYHVFDREVPLERDKWELFHLSDYAVSSAVSGPAYVLTPRMGKGI